jgi:histidinol phosphatase-like PHP family hydrolase
MGAPLLNLHNHTPFSDGAYDFDEICQAHLDLADIRVDGVGFSDHLFCTPSSREVKSPSDFAKLFEKETRRYLSLVREVQARWTGRLQVFCGCEINWPLNRHLLDQIREMLAGFDFVLFEYVDWAGLTQLANRVRRWTCPVGLAHFNVADQCPHTSLEQVVRTMANARIFYEINSLHMTVSLSDPWFKIMPEHRIQVALGTDTHDDLDCLASLGKLDEFVTKAGLDTKRFVPHSQEALAAAAS